MLATRAPVFGIVIAVVVLLAECIGLLAYKYNQQPVEAPRVEARVRTLEVDRLGREIEGLDARITKLRRVRCSLDKNAQELEALRLQLRQLRHDRQQLNRMLVKHQLRQPR